jgi:hypothetical protein
MTMLFWAEQGYDLISLSVNRCQHLSTLNLYEIIKRVSFSEVNNCALFLSKIESLYCIVSSGS